MCYVNKIFLCRICTKIESDIIDYDRNLQVLWFVVLKCQLCEQKNAKYAYGITDFAPPSLECPPRYCAHFFSGHCKRVNKSNKLIEIFLLNSIKRIILFYSILLKAYLMLNKEYTWSSWSVFPFRIYKAWL